VQESVTYSASLEFYLAISLILPFISFIISFLISDRYAWAISFTAPLFQFISFCCALVVWIGLIDSPHIVQIPWFTLGDHIFTANLEISKISALMLVVVTFISFLVHVYSTGYMAGYAGNRRYFSVLSFFTFSMLGIVVSNDLLVLFIFWELVGFSSYLLIGHWMEKPEAAAAAKKAFIINRIADAGFVVGLMIVWTRIGTFNITEILFTINQTDYLYTANSGWWTASAGLCIFIGVMGKSAQFPFFTWLPDAMAGPTPVSALIHAATMVAAGVYLVVRLNWLFTPWVHDLISIIGALTALLAALAAFSQYDVKRILAYSTISQLGLMLTDPTGNSAFLHLTTHAFFKAGLFLAAGTMIHALHHAQHHSVNEFDVQDIRNLGGLRKRLPFTFLAFIICGASLAGLPFTSGFLSKDALLMVHFHRGMSRLDVFVISALFTTSFITVVYTFRMIWFVFFGVEKNTRHLNVSEAPWVMKMPVAVLIVASTWLIYARNPFDVEGWLPALLSDEYTRSIGTPVTLITFVWVILALGVAFFFYRKRTVPSNLKILQNAFGIDWFTTLVASKTSLAAATATSNIDRRLIDKGLHFIAYANVTIAHLAGWFDRNIIDGLVHTVAATSRGIGSFTRSFQNGKIQMYIFWAALALIIFIIWNLF
jgi:NADH-quinone oxidoreductase subunit L